MAVSLGLILDTTRRGRRSSGTAMVSSFISDSIGKPAATLPRQGISVARAVPRGGRTSMERLSL